VNWIFFPPSVPTIPRLFHLNQVENEARPLPQDGWSSQASIQRIPSTLATADDARETRGTYAQDKRRDTTKTSNASISDAANQVALAAQAIIHEEVLFSQALSQKTATVDSPSPPYSTQLFVPVIATTARIFTCEFDPAHVSTATGEIPLDKVTIKDQPFLVYEYLLPRSLQGAPTDLARALEEGALDLFTRMHILIVQSSWLGELLNTLTGRLSLPTVQGMGLG